MSRLLTSWGGYPYAPQTGHTCSWRKELPSLLTELTQKNEHVLPHGNGRSYGDSCLAASDHVLHTRFLDRFLKADWRAGVIRVEAGVTLADLLAVAIPRGWFLPVTPGTQFATIGGAIANDVHGKNHHRRGTFGQHVLRFQLVRSDQDALLCSLDTHPDLFAATIGGLGLTGIISWADIKLMPIASARIDRMAVRFNSLKEFFVLTDELDARHEYSVAWVDCSAKGAETGRGVLFVGDHAPEGSFENVPRSNIAVPLTPPVSLMNKLSLRAFNEAYWRLHSAGRTHQRTDCVAFFYPLDRIVSWNRLYGRKGFQQYQCVISPSAASDAVAALLKAIAESGRGSFLAVLKRCGAIASPGLLSFPMSGTSLALDFPQATDLERLFKRLDDIVRAAGGRLYPAKDAHMSAHDFQQSYPAWEQLEALRDPTLLSRFWKRVTQ